MPSDVEHSRRTLLDAARAEVRELLWCLLAAAAVYRFYRCSWGFSFCYCCCCCCGACAGVPVSFLLTVLYCTNKGLSHPSRSSTHHRCFSKLWR